MTNLTGALAAQHIAQCNNYATTSPATLEQTCKMVLHSIRQPFHRLGGILADIEQQGYSSNYLKQAIKVEGHAYISSHATELYVQVMATDCQIEQMEILLQIPGIGLAKAGFILQLCFNDGGCLDTHNLAMYGLDSSITRYNPKALTKTRHAKIAAYLACCQQLGGSAALWRTWCEFIAAKYPAQWDNAMHVSVVHLPYIKEA